MRVLMVTDFYWPFLGGVEQHVRSLSTELAARGHQVAVATLWQEGLAESERDGDVLVRRLRSTTQNFSWLFKHPGRPWAPPIADPGVTQALWSIVQSERPEIVHGHDWLARSFLPLKRASQAKLAMSLHYYTLTCAKKNLMYREAPCAGPAFPKCATCAASHYGALKGLPVALATWTMRHAEQRAVDIFLPVSRTTASGNGLVGSGLPFEVVPNFIPSTLRADEELDGYLAQLPLTPYFLFVGDFRRHKGLDVLLAAYRKLRQLRTQAKLDVPPLVLIGKTWDETPASFPPGVVVRHNWPNHAVMAAWSRSLAAVVPSIWPEPFGIVVIEAMTAGRPVIGTNIGGIADIVLDGETGLLVPPRDPDALSSAMLELVMNHTKREQMGKASQRRAQLYQAHSVVPRFEAIYQQLLSRATLPA